MAKEKGADKTEQPTPKRLRDARRDGDVHKSRELTSTMLVLVWFVMGWLMIPFFVRTLSGAFERSFAAMQQPFEAALPIVLWEALVVLGWLTVPFFIVAMFVAAVTEFLQVGAIFAFTKVKPNLSHVNPAEGIKKMFSQENLVDVAKSLVKSAALILIVGMVVWFMLGEILMLPWLEPLAMGTAFWQGVVKIAMWTVFVFAGISVMDAFYQKFAYLKNLRMSRRDIRQELKENEGDPHIKGHRRQLHEEWAQQNMLQSVRQASVVVTNPTHIAVALRYDPEETDLPIVTAKGEGYFAEMIKRTAEESGVPVLQNIPLARGLHAEVEIDQYVSPEFFEAVAEVLRWAEEVRGNR